MKWYKTKEEMDNLEKILKTAYQKPSYLIQQYGGAAHAEDVNMKTLFIYEPKFLEEYEKDAKANNFRMSSKAYVPGQVSDLTEQETDNLIAHRIQAILKYNELKRSKSGKK